MRTNIKLQQLDISRLEIRPQVEIDLINFIFVKHSAGNTGLIGNDEERESDVTKGLQTLQRTRDELKIFKAPQVFAARRSYVDGAVTIEQ